jgi:DsbC/DsbD-like thiol-disulfide interchange protein
MRLTALFSALFVPALLHAQNAGNPLEVRLISATRSISAGKTLNLGLHLRHPAGSHSYWKHPGIVGLPTTVEWELPAGFKAGEIEWPAPAMVMMACYETQGYEGETLLMIPITVPEGLTAKSATLAAKVSWMCCGKTCMPAMKVPFSITLPVAASAEADPATQPMFKKFRPLVPVSNPACKTGVTRSEGNIVLTLKPSPPNPVAKEPGGIRFFTADGQVNSNEKQTTDVLPDGTIRMRLVLSEHAPKNPATLPGVVVFPAGWQSGGLPMQLEINPAY